MAITMENVSCTWKMVDMQCQLASSQMDWVVYAAIIVDSAKVVCLMYNTDFQLLFYF